MFSICVLDIKIASVIFREMASCVILPGEEGEFSILDFHQPIMACLKEGVIKIDEEPYMHIKKGIVKAERNELIIFVER